MFSLSEIQNFIPLGSWFSFNLSLLEWMQYFFLKKNELFIYLEPA